MRAILIEKGKEPRIVSALESLDLEAFGRTALEKHIKADIVVLEATDDETDTDAFENWLTFFDELSKDGIFDLYEGVIVL